MDLEFTLVVNVAGEDTPKVREDVRELVESTLGVVVEGKRRRASGPVWVDYIVTPRGLRGLIGCPYPMNEREYVSAGGGQCPNCGDPQINIEYRSVDFEGGGVYQRAICHACDFEWYDKYHLAGFDVLEVPA